MAFQSSSFSNFDPRLIPWQDDALDAILGAPYQNGVHEFMLSGAVGSAKTTLGVHVAARHCMENVGARCMLGRRARPDLKRTLFAEVIEHLDDEHLEEGVHYQYWEGKLEVKFPPWKSEMIPGFWADRKFKRFRSMKLSMALLEELTETPNEHADFYPEILMRLNRIGGYTGPNLLLTMTNPDSPLHWAYERYMEQKTPLRRVFYSKTEDNPFLAKTYLEQLKTTIDPRMALRMLYGQWIELMQDRIYYAYDTDLNFRKDTAYKWDPALPIDIMHDFNIAGGKPMSAAIGQVRKVEGRFEFHVARTVLIDGARTGTMIEEIANLGVLEMGSFVRVFGDAAGKHNDTRNNKSDYDIIRQYLANYRTRDGKALAFEFHVPLANPPLRTRHNLMNAGFCDATGKRSIFLYKDAVSADKGFRLANLKKGASLDEDDTLREQHVTTAIGYWVTRVRTITPTGTATLS